MRDDVVRETFHRVDGPRLKLVHQRLSVRVCNCSSIPGKGCARFSGAIHGLKDEPFVTVWLHGEVGPQGLAVVPMAFNPQLGPVG